MARIIDLPVEIVAAITSLCSSAEIRNLCQTCHLLNGTCHPQLYHTIDLSSHNSDIGCEPWGFIRDSQSLVPADFVARELTELDKTIFERQRMLLKTFAANQTFAIHVKTLRWTVLDTSDLLWGFEIPIDSDVESEAGVDEEPTLYTPEDEPMWNMFRSFINVSIIDICWIREWREVTLPGPIFPSATTIRLGGCMSREFVSCVLATSSRTSTRPSQLIHLDFNNLFEWSRCEPPLPQRDHIRDLVEFINVNRSNIKTQSERLPMVGHLEPLIGSCKNLKSLRIGTIGLSSELWHTPRSDLLYASWASFLGSVQDTLQSFHFDQGFNRNDETRPKGGCRPGMRRSSNHRPMDELFIEHILPGLLKAPWPRMKHMVIHGVGRKKHTYNSATRPDEEDFADPSIEWSVQETQRDGMPQYTIEKTYITMPTQARERLRALLGGGDNSEAVLIIEEEQGRDWEYLHCGNTGVPRQDV